MTTTRALKGVKHLTVAGAARELGVSPSTVRRWCDKNRLRHLRHPHTDVRLIPASALSSMRDVGVSNMGGRLDSGSSRLSRLVSRAYKLIGLAENDVRLGSASFDRGIHGRAYQRLSAAETRLWLLESMPFQDADQAFETSGPLRNRVAALRDDVDNLRGRQRLRLETQFCRRFHEALEEANEAFLTDRYELWSALVARVGHRAKALRRIAEDLGKERPDASPVDRETIVAIKRQLRNLTDELRHVSALDQERAGD